MKTKLIKLQDKFILVSDEDNERPKIGNWYFDGSSCFKCVNDYSIPKSDKVIAGISSLPSIDLSLLSEEDCKTIGWVDVEKLKQKVLNKYIGKLSKSCHSPENIDKITDRDWFGLWEGFKIALSLNDKMFSLEDIRNAFIAGNKRGWSGYPNTDNHTQPNLKTYIQSLQQTSWNVEIEMESYVSEHIPWSKEFESKYDYEKGYPVTKSKPKVTNNSIKIIKLI